MIRLAIKEDALALNTVIHQAYRTDASHFKESHLVKSPRITLESLNTLIDSPTNAVSELYVFEDNSTIKGSILLEQSMNASHAFTLGLFSVNPDFQSQGIGRALIQFCINRGKALGFKSAVMSVIDARVDILEWYAKLGFRWRGKVEPFTVDHGKAAIPLQFKVLVLDI